MEKKPIGGYARRAGKKNGEGIYETKIEIPGDFGEIGGVLLQNELRNEMYIKHIVINGLSNGPLAFNCTSWVQSKFDNPEKRIFFTNKVRHAPPNSILVSIISTVLFCILAQHFVDFINQAYERAHNFLKSQISPFC